MATEELSATVQALIDQVLARRRDLTADERDQLAQALRAPCTAADDRMRGCAAEPGHECRSLVDGLPLGRLLFHEGRRRNAGVVWAPTSPHELKGNPKRISETGRGERMRRESGKAYPGWEDDQRRWADR